MVATVTLTSPIFCLSLNIEMIKHRYKRSRSSALTEINQHLAITLPHILWHGQDAGDIVVQE